MGFIHRSLSWGWKKSLAGRCCGGGVAPYMQLLAEHGAHLLAHPGGQLDPEHFRPTTWFTLHDRFHHSSHSSSWDSKKNQSFTAPHKKILSHNTGWPGVSPAFSFRRKSFLLWSKYINCIRTPGGWVIARGDTVPTIATKLTWVITLWKRKALSYVLALSQTSRGLPNVFQQLCDKKWATKIKDRSQINPSRLRRIPR